MIYYMTMNRKDYYRILSVGHNATPEQIRQAYRNLAFQYHPDRNKGNPSATERMKEINEAYATLSNAQKRREYDALKERYGDLAYERFSGTHRQEDIFRNSDIHQIFEEFARTFGFRGPGDIFGEFYGSRYRSFQFQGIFGGGFIFYDKSRRVGTRGQEGHLAQWPGAGFPLPGVLGRVVKYLLQRTFGIQFPERGQDRWDVLTLSPEEAQSGGEVEYHCGKWEEPKNLMVKVPPGIRSGQRVRLRGMGSPGKGGGKAGDLYLQVKIKRPRWQGIRNLLTKIRSRST